MEQLTKTHLRKSMPSFSLMEVCMQWSDVLLTDTELFELKLVIKHVYLGMNVILMCAVVVPNKK